MSNQSSANSSPLPSCPVHTRLCVLRREYSSGQNISSNPARSLFSAHPPVPCELVDCDVRVDLVQGLICRFSGHRALGSTRSCCGGVGFWVRTRPLPWAGCLVVLVDSCARPLLCPSVSRLPPLCTSRVTARRPYGDGPSDLKCFASLHQGGSPSGNLTRPDQSSNLVRPFHKALLDY